MALYNVNVLIVGRSGNGKSSIGNSILREVKFNVCTLGEELKSRSDVDLKPITGKGFSVIECLCIKDADEAYDHGYQEAKKATDSFKSSSNRSADVILFVMKYGVRYTQQEKQAVQMLRQIFGETVFRDWVILVFSYGDNFENDVKEKGDNFENDVKDMGDEFKKWCRAQTGDVKVLFEEVDYRIVLFNNKEVLPDSSILLLNEFITSLNRCDRGFEPGTPVSEATRFTMQPPRLHPVVKDLGYPMVEDLGFLWLKTLIIQWLKTMVILWLKTLAILW
nr:dentin sialophosphoprotein-like [Biomphalaria glabrata]